MNDIIARLRGNERDEPLCYEAADEIERLTYELKSWKDAATKIIILREARIAELETEVREMRDYIRTVTE